MFFPINKKDLSLFVLNTISFNIIFMYVCVWSGVLYVYINSVEYLRATNMFM